METHYHVRRTRACAHDSKTECVSVCESVCVGGRAAPPENSFPQALDGDLDPYHINMRKADDGKPDGSVTYHFLAGATLSKAPQPAGAQKGKFAKHRPR